MRKGPKVKPLDSITDSMDMNLSKLWEIVEDRGAWRAVVHGVINSQTQLSDRTTTAFRLRRTVPGDGEKVHEHPPCAWHRVRFRQGVVRANSMMKLVCDVIHEHLSVCQGT